MNLVIFSSIYGSGYFVSAINRNANSHREAGGIVLKIGYGYTIEPHDRDPLVDLADKAMEDFSSALLPATWAVDFIPLCK